MNRLSWSTTCCKASSSAPARRWAASWRTAPSACGGDGLRQPTWLANGRPATSGRRSMSGAFMRARTCAAGDGALESHGMQFGMGADLFTNPFLYLTPHFKYKTSLSVSEAAIGGSMNARATSTRWMRSSARRSTSMRPCAACIGRIAPPNCAWRTAADAQGREDLTTTRRRAARGPLELAGELRSLLSQQTNQRLRRLRRAGRGEFGTPLGHLADRAVQKNVYDSPSVRL
jgi:hypothetical protein